MTMFIPPAMRSETFQIGGERESSGELSTVQLVDPLKSSLLLLLLVYFLAASLMRDRYTYTSLSCQYLALSLSLYTLYDFRKD